MEQDPREIAEAVDALTQAMIRVHRLAPEAAPTIIHQKFMTTAKIVYNERMQTERAEAS